MRIAPNTIRMIRFALYFFVVISLLATISCTSRNRKLDHDNLIPDKDLVSILADVYIADGLLGLPKIHTLYESLDSITAYYHVIEKHGYTKETMDKTMKYYFVKDPKKLIKIYDQVLGQLSEMESRTAKEAILEAAHFDNLWRGKEFYFFPGTSDFDSTGFDIPITKPGFYSLAFSVTLFPDDQSVNPRITAYSCNSDSLETGTKRYAKTINYIKDGRPHTYSFSITVTEKATIHYKGILYDFNNYPDVWEKHILIEKISFTYSSVAML